MALPAESQGVFERDGVPVLYTGVGKINAAWALTRKLSEYHHASQPRPLVVNFGTAGSRSLATHTLVACRSFVQHDMDVTGLGFARGTTPFDESPARIDFDPVFADLPHAICASGDSFQTGECAIACDVVDMEAYALAKVCWLEQVRFVCVKYVTDGADHASASDWQDNLHRAADEFLRCYRELAAGR
jgi:adenosylhomocysteine nucleosidase